MEQFIILLVLGAISFLFNRAKGNQQKEEKKRTIQQKQMQRPTTVNVETVQEKREEPRARTFEQEKPQTLREAAEVFMQTMKEETQSIDRKQNQQSHVENRSERLQEKLEANKQRLANLAKKNEETLVVIEEHRAKAPKLTFTQDDVLKGIIMAEVLGPPRALKRHRKSIMRRY